MSFIKIIDAFTFYGLDIVLLAALTCITVQILKLTLLKKCQKKIITFLPFVTGILFYAAYTCAVHLSASYAIDNYVEILEHGFSVGALSTVIYVWYEQFIREKSGVSATEGVIATLIEGYVPTEAVEETAKKIADAILKDVTGQGAAKTAEILSDNAESGITERDVELLAKLIIETLAHMSGL